MSLPNEAHLEGRGEGRKQLPNLEVQLQVVVAKCLDFSQSLACQH